MTFEEFDKFTEEIFIEVRRMRDTKGKEYAHTKDRFDNFNRLGTRMSIPRLKVWLVYFTKHMDSIESYINEGREFSSEKIRGRIVDAMTYLALLAGMIYEDASQHLLPIQTEELELSPVQCRCRKVFTGVGDMYYTDSDSCPIESHKPGYIRP